MSNTALADTTRLPQGFADKEHWFPALLQGRRAGVLQLSAGERWPQLHGPGLPTKGWSIAAVHSVIADESRWWMRLLGHRTLRVEGRRGQDAVFVHTFVGSAERVKRIEAEVVRRTQFALDRLGRRLSLLLDGFEAEHRSLFVPTRYVRHSQVARLVKAQEELTGKDGRVDARRWMSHPMHAPSDARGALRDRLQKAYAFLDAAEEERRRHNSEFVASQRDLHADYFARVESERLTPEQIEASLHFDDANVTVAAAGSGKTSVMVSKVGYAISSGLLKEHEILVLAYNRAAAKELRERISDSLQRSTGRAVKVEVRTFHSLGFSLWRKQRRAVGLATRPHIVEFERSDSDALNEVDSRTGSLSGKRLLREVLLSLAEDPADRSFSNAVMKWASAYRFPTPELDPSDDLVLHERKSRYDAMCRQMARRKGVKAFEPTIPTFDPQVWVRSTEEARLCNWLYLRHVPFTYEDFAPRELQERMNAELPVAERNRPYRPDFTYPNPNGSGSRFVHEHFGVDREGRAPAFMGRLYEARTRYKRTVLNRALGENFFETTSGQFDDGTIFKALERALKQRGIPVASPDPERWEQALKTFIEEESVVNLIAAFIVKFRDSGLTMDEVEARLQRMSGSGGLRASSFLEWMKPLMARLDERMASWQTGGRSRPLLDYAGMIGGAVQALGEWAPGTLPFKLVLVDEFQDISRLRARLVQGLLDQHPGESMLYCVGDDWQSINRFAGSDVGIFKRVYDGLNGHPDGAPLEPRWTAQSMLSRTFRCPQGIADVARWFVMRGDAGSELIDKPVKSIKQSKRGVVRVVEHVDSGEARWSMLEEEIERIAERHAAGGKAEADVFILMRNKKDASLPDGLDTRKVRRLAERYKDLGLKITRDSMHGSKGLGAEYVVLVGMDCGFRGFPSDRWDEPLIEALLPARKSALDEERRLFYVALTRAKVQVSILCAANRPSMFVHELEHYPGEGVIDFERLPGVVRYLCPKCKHGWLKRQHRKGRVDCMRTPFCTFVASDGRYPGLPPSAYQ